MGGPSTRYLPREVVIEFLFQSFASIKVDTLSGARLTLARLLPPSVVPAAACVHAAW